MTSPCSIVLLESALAGRLPATDEDALHRHLEECEACSAALERLAGGPAWCQEAASLLTADELDVAVPTRDGWSEVDFTVEHLDPADDPNVLGRLGGYDVLGIIGHGGMGIVLKAFDRELKRCVAIKVLAPHLAQSSLAKKRFAREAQAAAAVVHPNVLAIHQVQPGGRLPFLVMPLVAGESLAERLTAQGTLELKEILRIGMQAAAGLAAAHEQGLVHRDVKPANILLEKGVERAVLTDFGLARAADDVTLTRWGVIAGTPQYMSPEQVRGEPLDGRSDLFSLGCVLYEMATGVSPFRTDSMVATLRRLVDDSPQAMAAINPELPPWFIATVDRLLQKDPSLRFNSAGEVSELLEGCLAHVQQPANVPLPAGLPKPVPPRAGRKSNILIKGVLAMIGTLGIGLLGLFLLAETPPDISGQWSGEDWGHVVLKKTSDTQYTGTYDDTSAEPPGSAHLTPPGEIQLKWSRVERRFNGTWREGENRFGEISLRLAGQEIRGAYTTDARSKINPATPRLADLAWIKAGPLARKHDETATVDPFADANPAAKSSDNDDVDPFADANASRTKNAWDVPARPIFELRGDGSAMVLAYSPNGNALAVGGDRAKVSLQNAKTGAPIWTLNLLNKEEAAILVRVDPAYMQAKTVEVSALEFSPDSAVLAVGTSIGQVKLFELRTGAFKFSLDGAGPNPADDPSGVKDHYPKFGELQIAHGRVSAIAFSPDGSLVATCGKAMEYNQNDPDPMDGPNDTLIKLWDAQTGVLRHVFRGKHIGEQRSQFVGVAFSPDGSVLASAEHWHTDARSGVGVQLFNPHTGQVSRTLAIREGGGVPSCIRYSPDGKRLALGMTSQDSANPEITPGLINLLNATSGALELGWAVPRSVEQVAFSEDGKIVAALSGFSALTLWDSSTGLPKREIHPTEEDDQALWRSFALAPKGDRVAIGGSDERHDFVTVWGLAGPPRDPKAEIKPRTFRLGDPTKLRIGDRVVDLAYSPDGKTLAVADALDRPDRTDSKVRLIDSKTGAPIATVNPLDEDEQALFSASESASEPEVTALAFAPNSSLLAVGTQIGQVKLFDARTGKRKLALDDVDRTPVAGEIELRLAHKATWAIAFSPDGSLLATCGADRGSSDVKLWDTKTGELKRNLKGEFDMPVVDVAFSPDGKTLASAGQWDARARTGAQPAAAGVKLWDPATGKVTKVLAISQRGPELRTPRSFAFSPDGTRLAIGIIDHLPSDNDPDPSDHLTQSIDVVETASGILAASWSVPDVQYRVRSVAFSPDGKMVAALSSNPPLTFWDASTGMPRRVFRPPSPAAKHEDVQWSAFAFAPQGNLLAVGGYGDDGGIVWTWDLAGQRLDPK